MIGEVPREDVHGSHFPNGAGVAVCVLMSIAALAALLPARRALHVNLAKALHCD